MGSDLARGDWRTSDRMQSVVIGRLLARDGPVRFQDLWNSCKDDLSKASFVKALRDLSESKMIVRSELGPKHVEFWLNPGHPEVRKTLSTRDRLISEVEKQSRFYQRVIDANKVILQHVPKGTLRRKIVRALVFNHASFFAVMSTMWTFAEADIESTHGESALEKSLVANFIDRFRLLQKKAIVDILKTNHQLAENALNEWASMLQANMEKVTVKAIS